jgi:O-antigen/teichoic acid export membrane protein
MILSTVPLINGLENIGTVEFRKQLEFDKEFRFIFAKKLASFVVVIPLAIAFRNYWALVVGVVTGRAAGLGLSYLLQPYRPRLSLAARHELFNFSKWLLINNITQFLLHRAPDIIVGRISGPGALGLFNISHEIAYLPSNELVAPINRAVFPGYAKKSGSLDSLRRGFLDVMSVIGLFMIPAAVGMFLTADLLVPVLLGEKWLGAEALIRLLAFAGLMFALQTNPTYVYLALGKPRLVTMLTILYVALLQPLMIFATRRAGPLGAAWAYVGTAAVVLPVTYGALLRKLELRSGALFAQLWRPLVAAGVMAATVQLVRGLLSTPGATPGRIAHLLAVVAAGVLIYASSVMALWRLCAMPAGAERFVWDWIRRRLGRSGGS